MCKAFLWTPPPFHCQFSAQAARGVVPEAHAPPLQPEPQVVRQMRMPRQLRKAAFQSISRWPCCPLCSAIYLPFLEAQESLPGQCETARCVVREALSTAFRWGGAPSCATSSSHALSPLRWANGFRKDGLVSIARMLQHPAY
jgi:hypothetical protein